MPGKSVSPRIMRFAVVFIILFRISFGFHLHFGLDEIFHGLTIGKSGLFNFGKYHESKQVNHTHDQRVSKDSRKETGSSQDPLKAIVETAGAVLNGSIVTDSLKTVAGTVGKAEKAVEGSLRTVAKEAGKAEKAVEGTLGTVAKEAGKAEKAVEGSLRTVSKEAGKAEKVVEGTLGTVVKTAGKAGGIVEGTLGTVFGTVNKTKSSSKVTDNLKTSTKEAGNLLDVIVKTADGVTGSSITVGSSETVDKKESKAKTDGILNKPLEIGTSESGGNVPALVGTLKTASGKKSQAVSSNVSKISSGAVAGKTDGAVRTLGGSLETALGDSDGAISSSDAETSSGVVAGKAGKSETSSSLDKSLEIDTSKTRGAFRTLGGSLETVSGKERGAKSSSVAESSSGAVAGKTGGAVRTLGGSLETGLGDTGGAKSRGVAESSSEVAGGKAGKSQTSGSSDKSLEIVNSKTGGAVRTLDGSLETISGRKNGAASSSVAESSSGPVARKAGGAVRTLGGSLETVSGRTNGASSSSVAESSSGTVARREGGAVRTLGGSLETVPGSTGGDERDIVVKSSSGSVDGKVGRVMNKKVYLGTANGNEDEEENKDDWGIMPKNVRETLESRVPSVRGGGKRGLNEEILKVPRDIRNKPAANSLQSIITDVAVAEACNTKSVVTGFPSYPPVSKFVHIFIQGVEESELLTKLFNITDATALQLSQFKYRYIADVFRKLGFIDANDIAAASVRHIAKYFDVIAPDVLLRVYANAFANYIFAEGFLTNENAEQQALNYIRAMQESAEGSGVICECDYNRNFQALGDGVFSFLLSMGEPSHTQAWGTAFYYAHDWLLAAVDYGSLRDPFMRK